MQTGGNVNTDIGVTDDWRLFARVIARARTVVPQLNALYSERPISFADLQILRSGNLAVVCGL